ncbi:hypothetical protein OUZ56_033454 [Daphnia magna]|uniref:DUF4806 domain-containing protein n=1 Tax=Daphnia magna TaxID=35525 RepID=A0ABQ9ZXV2_9CRUS|nr:hypothetical protein OUZ56_033454 [Daphnia magna]
MNSNLSLNAQHHQIIRPGPSRNENLRPKVNSNAGQGSMPFQQQYALTTPSSRVNSRQQSSQSLPEMPNAVFQDYTKRSLEFLKIQFREMTAKIDDLLDSRPKPCICTIQRIEENEQQFLLPLDSFDAIEHLENSMKDQQSRQQMKTVYAIMEKLFSYEIGTKFTWTGKSSKGIEKAKFSDLKNIYAAISGAVLGNKDLAGDEKTTVKVQYQVTEWLRHCQQNLKSQM